MVNWRNMILAAALAFETMMNFVSGIPWPGSGDILGLHGLVSDAFDDSDDPGIYNLDTKNGEKFEMTYLRCKWGERIDMLEVHYQNYCTKRLLDARRFHGSHGGNKEASTFLQNDYIHEVHGRLCSSGQICALTFVKRSFQEHANPPADSYLFCGRLASHPWFKDEDTFVWKADNGKQLKAVKGSAHKELLGLGFVQASASTRGRGVDELNCN